MTAHQSILFLRKIAKKYKLKVIFGSRRDGFSPQKGEIHICSRNSKDLQVIALAHELGHALAHQKIPGWIFESSEKELPTIILLQEDENRAWSEADKLIRLCGRHNAKYLRVKHKSLRSYYKNF